jgi:hypothetical protein
MQYAYRLVYGKNKQARKVYTKHFKAPQFEVGDEFLASFQINLHIPKKKLASIWKGLLLLKASPKHIAIKIHYNRVQLFNQLIDVVTTPVEEGTTMANMGIMQTVSNDNYKNSEDDDIYNFVDPSVLEQLVAPIQHPPV